ncbi:hypothetical protein FHT86_001009 [Rhizobium sp. BK313]|uniref:hypothetical protein n=1 Tax=Rhizobium sp. BK313 TaxID=2587081 RepID=UPI00106149AA|nr:hypothetical protein [Rhizobium sp. BK313]MBB3452753.1 hypothetical protein [Rhizobium sp. BK313]
MLAIWPTLAFPHRIRCPPDCFFADVGHFMPSLTPELGREAKVPDGHRDRTTKAIEASQAASIVQGDSGVQTLNACHRTFQLSPRGFFQMLDV